MSCKVNFKRLLHERHSVVKTFQFCLTRRINLTRLSSQQGRGMPPFRLVATGARWVLIAACMTVAGCAGLGTKSPQSLVQERAQERWDDLVKSDFQAAYAFLSPGSKQVISEKAYADSLVKGFWKSAQVQGVQCESESACEARVEIEYELHGRRMKTPLHEKWIKEDSKWWYLFRP